ncbi:2-phosphosulfolactate phosphatase [Neobacillus mesonae]|nr:2-phosphosulfolactate phosphatase [Neobacillus mesonae]
MRIDVVASVSEIRSEDLVHRSAVVIDVFRTSSTIVTALAQGAACVIPVETVPQAKQLQYNDMFRGGERFCKKISGFDAGNSPLEYKRELVQGKNVIMTTTSGTRALIKANKAETVFSAAFLNAKACAEALIYLDRDIVLLCAGSQDRFALEDGLCAGMLIDFVKQMTKQQIRSNDLGMTVYLAYLYSKSQLKETLYESSEAKRLIKQGHESDVNYCLGINQIPLVPILETDQVIRPWTAKKDLHE